ncbi:hypothetical protein [Lysinibacillus sp. CNPSo 3705]|uniref:hypothetical protein n=1 Tax=Lysinibacillus sp. CNPSo 3705 TaxID=3028148 RepID=UPI002363A247|nr:hypothetical protein [Lysinibacillus sp. CNPSo 3705]
MFDFNQFNKILEKNSKKNDVLKCGESYLYHILYHQLPVEQIDFSSFTLQDIDRVIDNFCWDFDYIEDTDEFNILPTSPLYAMASTYNVVHILNSTEVRKVKPKHKFL